MIGYFESFDVFSDEVDDIRIWQILQKNWAEVCEVETR